MIKEKIHHQKYLDCVQKAKSISMMMAATKLKARELDEENNMMWEGIKEMSTVIGDKSSLKNVSIDER